MATMTSPAAKADPAGAKTSRAPRTFMHNDFPYIRKASMTLASCALAGAALIGGSTYILSSLKNTKNQVQGELSQAREQLRQAELEKNEIRDFQPKYVRLVQRGFVGEEKRLDWVEHIRHIQESRRLLPLTYEISAQQPFQLDPSIQTGELELRGSRMQLHMDLLHEMDLLNFLTDLKSRGYFAVQECTIGPTDTRHNEPLAPRLKADCALQWITMGPRAAPTDAATEAANQ